MNTNFQIPSMKKILWFNFSLLLSFSSASVSTKPLKSSTYEENHDSPIGFKLTKYTNIQIDGKDVENWDQKLNNLIQDQIKENIEVNLQKRDLEQRSIPPQPISNSGRSIAEKHVHDFHNTVPHSQDCEVVNYVELCRRMLGFSKPDICKSLNDEQVRTNDEFLPRSCKDIQENGQNKSGIYKIQPKFSVRPFHVLCDMETRGGGWTHVQKRFDGSQDFYKEWREYKFGFGDLEQEFWIGLENIHHITGFEMNELLVEITDRNKTKAYAHYKGFSIGPETEGYILNTLRGFSGDAGDSLTEHLSAKFSTKDFDLDKNPGSCAQLFLGGWWYQSCHVSNLNGKFINVPVPDGHKFQGLHWNTFRGHEYCHSGSRMLVRPVEP